MPIGKNAKDLLMNMNLEVTDITCRILSDGHVTTDERLWLDDICEKSINAQIIRDTIMGLSAND